MKKNFVLLNINGHEGMVNVEIVPRDDKASPKVRNLIKPSEKLILPYKDNLVVFMSNSKPIAVITEKPSNNDEVEKLREENRMLKEKVEELEKLVKKLVNNK